MLVNIQLHQQKAIQTVLLVINEKILLRKKHKKKISLCGTVGRLFTTDVSVVQSHVTQKL